MRVAPRMRKYGRVPDLMRRQMVTLRDGWCGCNVGNIGTNTDVDASLDSHVRCLGAHFAQSEPFLDFLGAESQTVLYLDMGKTTITGHLADSFSVEAEIAGNVSD